MDPAAGATLTPGKITRFWSPLAATWVMMAVEGPLLAAIIARLPDPKINLAAYGVAFAIAILAEGPVIMLMTAATALVRDAHSYRRLRLFAHGLNGLSTLLLGVLLVPAVFEAVMLGAIGLPRDVADLVHVSLWIYLPWPAAIGYRRFVHGVMIISGKTRQVAVGTVFRLAAMAGTAFALASFSDLAGAWVGAAGLTVGVCTEALAARIMGAGAIRGTLATTPAQSGTPPLSWSGMVSFYYPLALTSLVALAIHPVLTFLVGRARAPLESLAVLPVIHSLSFLFRAVGLSYQEAAIALMGPEFQHRRAVARYAAGMAVATSAAYALFAVTPLFDFWFGTVSSLTAELMDYARLPAALIIPMPALSVWLAHQSAVMVMRRRTRAITVTTALGVVAIVAIFAVLAWGLGWIGATAACAAFMGGRLLSNLYLHRKASR